MWIKRKATGTKGVSERSGVAIGFAALALAGVFALALSACQQPTVSDLNAVTGSTASTSTTTVVPATTKAGAPDIISIVSGNAQTAVNGSQLSNQLTVRVTDTSGNAVPGVLVTFAVATGGGIIQTSASVFSDTSGFASATVLLGSLVGTQTFTASMSSGTVPTVTFNEISTAVASLVKIYPLIGTSSVGTTSILIGDTFTLRAVLVSSTGAFIKEIPATWWMTGSLTTANLSISGGNPSKYATLTPTVTGTGTINALVDDLTAIAANNITSTTTVTGTITVSLALTPDSISIVSGNAQTGQVGTNLAQNLVVKVVNPGGTAVPGVDVTFAVASGGGQIVSTQPVTTDANGLATCVVKLGGVAGTGHSFTATMASGTTRQVLFSAAATNGPAFALSFYQQPGGGNAGTGFSTQPKIQIQDSYGNPILQDSSSSVTLSVNSSLNGGALGGTLTMTATQGLVTFTNVSYSVGDTITIKATSSLSGVSTATSSSTVVGTIIAAGQCVSNGGGWVTTSGGCKDTSSGVVWSSLSASTYTWHQVVWDKNTNGSSAVEDWESARSISHDWYNTATNYDSNALAYCHDLVESGVSDWTVPTLAQITAASTDGATTYLKNAGTYVWSGYVTNSTQAYIEIPGTAAQSNQNMTAVWNARCVRQDNPTQLRVNTQVGGGTNGLGVNVAFATQPAIALVDQNNDVASWLSSQVTLTVTTGTGKLCISNPVTGVTSSCATSQTVNAVAGVATFTNLSYNKAETVTLTATSTGLTSVALAPFTVNQTYPLAACKLVGGVFINATGGCKDTTNGIIYASTSSSSMTWDAAVWDSATSGSEPQDSSDLGSNDYTAGYAPPAGYTDNNTTSYCHSLQESGQTDWRMPTNGDSMYYPQANGHSPATYLNVVTAAYTWAGLENGTTNNGWVGYTVTAIWTPRTGNYPVTCVRRDPPSALRFTAPPAGGTYGFGSGIVWPTQPFVDVLDAQGAGPLELDNTVITLTVQPASDGTGGTGKLLLYSGDKVVAEGTTYNGMTVAAGGQSVTLAASNGRASFSSLSYSKKGGEKFRLQASGTASWLGSNIALTSATTADLTVPALYSITQCNAQGGWASEYGGCHDTQGGSYAVVWSHVVSGGVTTWYDSIWDSALAGEDAADADDGGRTNDYDLVTYPPGTGVDNTTHNWCHRLNLNGYTDWRMPIWQELSVGYASGNHNGYSALNNTGAGAATYLWSSSTVAATPANAYLISFSGSGTSSAAKNSTLINGSVQFGTRCVRPGTP